MEFSGLVTIGGLLAGVVLLLLIWRAVRFVMRLALVGVMLLLLFGGALWWWYGYGAARESPSRATRPVQQQPARRAERNTSR